MTNTKIEIMAGWLEGLPKAPTSSERPRSRMAKLRECVLSHINRCTLSDAYTKQLSIDARTLCQQVGVDSHVRTYRKLVAELTLHTLREMGFDGLVEEHDNNMTRVVYRFW